MMLEALDIREESQLLLSGTEMVRDSRISSALERGRREVQVSHSRVELHYAQLIARRGSARWNSAPRMRRGRSVQAAWGL